MIAAALDVKLGPWRIWFDPPPIGTRSCDWHFQHEDTDLECPAWMNGDGPTFEACLTDIAESYEDLIASLTKEVEGLREALRNMMGAFDVPVVRRRCPPTDFMAEALQSGRDALSTSGRAET